MKTNMIKLFAIAAAAIAFSCTAFGRGYHHGPPPGHYGPRVHHAPHHYHHSAWGHNGRYFWPGFAGAAVGTVIANTILPPPPPPPVVIPSAPVVVSPIPVVVAPRPVVVPARPVVVW